MNRNTDHDSRPASERGDAQPHASAVQIAEHGGRYVLLRNGEPFFVKGAVANAYLERLASAGGNAIRAGVAHLDRAHSLGLAVLAGLRAGKPRWGFDYTDPAQVQRQLEEVLTVVSQHKGHPALLMWAIGNELELQTTAQERVPVWRAVNQLAEEIKKVDPAHPVITPIGDAYRFILHELDELCPALDAVGLNSYADMLTLPEDVQKQGWTRPYIITEFGPRGHWQVEKTPWGMPIEDTSSEKADFYMRAYTHAVLDRPQCLGSFAFHWSHHQEKTHTWYGMHLPDGSATEAVDVMTFLWTGRWPDNRAPRIGPGKLTVVCADGSVPASPNVFPPGEELRCWLDAADPDGDPIAVSWDLRVDVADNPNIGGDTEEPTQPIEGAVVESAGTHAVIRLPAKPGPYRIFAYAHDGKGSAATANVPILAAEP